MFLFSKQVKARGMDLINEVVDRFNDLIKDLNDGVADCQLEQDNIVTTIDELNIRNQQLNEAVNQAEKVAENLRALLSK